MRTKRTSSGAIGTKSQKGKRDNRPSSRRFHRPRPSLRTEDYTYIPLPTKTSIRILELQPGGRNELIECRLSIVERDQAPPYDAISYAWGNPKHTRVIRCEGRKLKVTANLRDALRSIRNPVQVKSLWADAVCIDQCNPEERGHQVRHMGSIFADAQRVIVWLGPSNSDDFDTIDNIETAFAALLRDTNAIIDGQEATLGYPNISQSRLEELDQERTRLWTAFAKLLSRPWFSRLWVVQEAGMGRSVDALVGDVEIEFGEILRLASWLGDRRLLANYFGLAAGYEDVFSVFPARGEEIYVDDTDFDYDFLECLEITRQQLASDPHDYVYALLGHPSAWSDGEPIVEPDYSKSAHELYTEIAVKLMAETKSLRILSAVHHCKESDLEEEFASWVPTWSRDRSVNSIAVFRHRSVYYDAAAGESAFFDLMACGKFLHVRGLVFDVIDEFTRIMDYIPNHRAAAGEDSVEQWPVSAAMRFSTRSTYSASQHLSEIAQTLTAGLARSDSHSGKRLSQLLADFAAFRLHLIKEAPRQASSPISGIAAEATTALQTAAESGDIDEFLKWAGCMCTNRKLFSTRHGLLGLGPGVLRKGDLCCIIFGATIPFILRPVGQRYRLVGESYIHGVMQGEAIVDWILAEKYQEQDFEIF